MDMDILPLILTDEELLLLSGGSFKSRVYHNQAKLTEAFNLDNLSEDYCWTHFRFYKGDLIRLKTCLKIPDLVKTNTFTVSGLEGLCIVLKRLSYPNRYEDLMKYFPRTRCELSRILSCFVNMLLQNHLHRLTDLNQAWLSLTKVQELCDHLVEKGCPFQECFGFLDGTVRPICRPQTNQKQYYNGHKRVHAIKFQSLSLPNGIILNLHGPIQGRRHDGFLLQSSGLLSKLVPYVNSQGRPYHLYGDPAYPLSPHLLTPFKPHEMNPQRRRYNKIMSSIRESVEWGFCKVINIFSFLDYKKTLKSNSSQYINTTN